jgi:hypothetical protein
MPKASTTLFDQMLKTQPTTDLADLASKCIAELQRRAKREPRAAVGQVEK